MGSLENISARLKAFREHLGESQSSIATKSGVFAKDISRMESGVAKYLIEAYLQYLYSQGMNVNWLYFGDGNMIRQDAHPNAHLNAHPNPETANKSYIKVQEPGKVQEPEVYIHEFPTSIMNGQFRPNRSDIDLNPAKSLQDRINMPPIIIEYKGDFGDFAPIKVLDQKAAAGYPASFQDKEYWDELPEAVMPVINRRSGFYIMIQVTGDSMTPRIYHGDWVFCRYVDNLDDVKDGFVYVIVTKDGVVLKKVLNRIKKRDALALKSFNPAYPTYDQKIEDILQIWRPEHLMSTNFSNPNEDIFKRVDILEGEMAYMKRLLEGK